MYFFISFEFIFLSSFWTASYISNNSCFCFKLFDASLLIPVIIIFSFALVRATYKIRISSDKVSLCDFILIASFAKVLYSILLSSSINFGPNPISWWNNIGSFKSLKLNPFPVPHRKTTGNSSPLLLWILIILTTSSFSPIILAEDISLLVLWTLSMKFIKLYSPLKLASSYFLAFSKSIFKFACLRAPFGIKPT